jgi:hypothetical protein
VTAGVNVKVPVLPGVTVGLALSVKPVEEIGIGVATVRLSDPTAALFWTVNDFAVTASPTCMMSAPGAAVDPILSGFGV